MQNERLRVLVAPMDWGLGHATRCIPLVNTLQNLGIEVIIAAEGAQLSLLKKEFPHLNFIHLQGYRIRYSNSKRLLPVKIALQIPKILLTVEREYRWLKKNIPRLNIHAVISDNRFGLHNKNICSVFITHQLTIDTPFNAMTDVVRKLNYRRIEKFDECWVPDFEDFAFSLAGKLSHPSQLPKLPTYYIGMLSRFQKAIVDIRYQFTALISGPEPQRTLFEEKIRKYFPYLNGQKCLVLGKPNRYRDAENETNIDVFNHQTAEQLQQTILSSEYVVCRSGYSTLMDLVTLNKSAMLVPTPGQTEQEYLAKYLAEKSWFTSSDQEELNAAVIVQRTENNAGTLPKFPFFDLNAFLSGFAERVKARLK